MHKSGCVSKINSSLVLSFKTSVIIIKFEWAFDDRINNKISLFIYKTASRICLLDYDLNEMKRFVQQVTADNPLFRECMKSTVAVKSLRKKKRID